MNENDNLNPEPEYGVDEVASTTPEPVETPSYVTRDDLNSFRDELLGAMRPAAPATEPDEDDIPDPVYDRAGYERYVRTKTEQSIFGQIAPLLADLAAPLEAQRLASELGGGDMQRQQAIQQNLQTLPPHELNALRQNPTLARLVASSIGASVPSSDRSGAAQQASPADAQLHAIYETIPSGDRIPFDQFKQRYGRKA